MEKYTKIMNLYFEKRILQNYEEYMRYGTVSEPLDIRDTPEDFTMGVLDHDIFQRAPEAKAPETPAPAAEAAPAKDPFEGLELDDAYLRMRRVTSLPGDEVNLEILPTGERIVFVGTEGKDRGIFSVKWDGSEQKKVAPGAAIVGLNFAGDRIVALGAGGAQTIGLAGDAKSFDISATSEVELAKRNAQKLEEVSRIMGGKFYKIRPVHSFATQMTSALVILSASVLGLPVSTSQVVSSAIIGVGSSERLGKIRWEKGLPGSLQFHHPDGTWHPTPPPTVK
jgi:hypothetical protein